MTPIGTVTPAPEDDCSIPVPSATPTPSDTDTRAGIIIEQDRIGCADPGTTVTYAQTIRNASAREQMVNVSAFSALAWDVAVYASDGRTELTDSNSDGRVDVGVLGPNDAVDVVVAVSVPRDAPQGLHDVVLVMVFGIEPDTKTGQGSSATIRTAATQG